VTRRASAGQEIVGRTTHQNFEAHATTRYAWCRIDPGSQALMRFRASRHGRGGSEYRKPRRRGRARAAKARKLASSDQSRGLRRASCRVDGLSLGGQAGDERRSKSTPGVEDIDERTVNHDGLLEQSEDDLGDALLAVAGAAGRGARKRITVWQPVDRLRRQRALRSRGRIGRSQWRGGRHIAAAGGRLQRKRRAKGAAGSIR
jgi:hypothetical protein